MGGMNKMSELKEIKITLDAEPFIPQKRLSPSSINTYHKCPRQYYYNYIAKLKTKPNIHLVKGSIVHKVLEDFFRGYRPEMEANILKIFERVWGKNEQQIKNLELPEEEIKQAKQDCLNMINEYFISFKRKIKSLIQSGKAENESHAYYLLKPKFREVFVEDKEIHCCGFIDRVNEDYNNTLTIGDYKTSAKYGIGLPVDYKRQLAIYSLLYTNQEKRQPDFAAVNFLRYGEEYLLEVTPSLLRYARDTIRLAYQQTRSTDIKDYPLYEDNLCRWCSYKGICNGQEDFDTIMREERLKSIIKNMKDIVIQPNTAPPSTEQ